jgi:hypothetical protein
MCQNLKPHLLTWTQRPKIKEEAANHKQEGRDKVSNEPPIPKQNVPLSCSPASCQFVQNGANI